LHKILDFVWESAQPAPQEGTQVGAQGFQEQLVGRGIAGQPQQQLGTQTLFVGLHVFQDPPLYRYSLHAADGLHRVEKIVFRPDCARCVTNTVAGPN